MVRRGPTVDTAGDGPARTALVTADRARPLDASVTDLLTDWDTALPRLRALAAEPDGWTPLAEHRVHAPVAPRQVIQAGANYRTHVIDLAVRHQGEEVREGTAAMMDRRAAEGEPCFFLGLPTVITGPYDDVAAPRPHRTAGRTRRDGWGDYAGGPAPGLSFTTAEWLHRSEIAAIATDTWGFEVRPNEFDEAFQPLHQVAIPRFGMFLGEMWDLDALAADCAADGRYAYFLTAAPLPVTGAVGAPVNPLAVK